MIGAIVGLTLLPFLLVIALLVDIVFRRWKLTTVRIVIAALVYLWVSVGIQVWGLMVWIATGFGRTMWEESGQRLVYLTIRAWMRSMLFVLRILGCKVRYDTATADLSGRVILIARHESMGDVFVPTWFADSAGKRLRVVLTAGLNREPSLDLFGHRSPQFFVKRDATDKRAEVEAMKRFPDASDDNTAFVIWPEGALVRPERRVRVLARLEKERPDLAERAHGLRHLLAPRVAGVSALLDGADDAAVVLVGHTGFDQLTDPRTCWRSVPLDREVELISRRYERSEVPDSLAEREVWLFDRWDEMDDWIDAKLNDRP